MDNNVQNIRSGRALAGFGKFFSGLGLVIAAIGAILGGAVPVMNWWIRWELSTTEA